MIFCIQSLNFLQLQFDYITKLICPILFLLEIALSYILFRPSPAQALFRRKRC